MMKEENVSQLKAKELAQDQIWVKGPNTIDEGSNVYVFVHKSMIKYLS